MKTLQKSFKSILMLATIILFSLTSCNNQAEKIKTMQASIDSLKMSNDSLVALSGGPMKKNKTPQPPGGIRAITQSEAVAMVTNYVHHKPKILALNLYSEELQYFSQNSFGSKISIALAADSNKTANLVVFATNNSTAEYYTFNLTDTAVAPGGRTCPPCMYCPPGVPCPQQN